ncbi:MAG TPA: type II toxin-antitoxin system RelE/ParE family toxin [Pyrinomonadaceae bacterium]|jgi:mRNA interferase RelE/StbE
MASYKVEWKRSGIKELRDLPKDAVERILKAVEQLSENPYPIGVRKLVGAEHTYRLREGNYRVLYTITAASMVVQIIRVGHRKDVYDR